MPFINTKTNVKISKDKELAIKSKFGRAISALGKSESWLMLNFEDEQKMYFKGEDTNKIVFVSVDYYGSENTSGSNTLTGIISDILYDELDIDKSNIYVKYSPISSWGWNGENF